MTDEYGKYKFHYCKDSGPGSEVCHESAPEQVPPGDICTVKVNTTKFARRAYQNKSHQRHMYGKS
jgi:hypothetical protein